MGSEVRHSCPHPDISASGPAVGRPRGGRWVLSGGTEGNERLTVVTGALLIVLLAALGVTIVFIGRLLWWHLFLGLALMGPVALKVGSTGYRFMRYYAAEPRYRAKGLPHSRCASSGPSCSA